MLSVIEERIISGKRLGRHVEHDRKSKKYPAARHLKPLKNVDWQRHCPAFDQGDIGSCTGNALVGALMTDPLWNGNWNFTQETCLEFYKLATKIDRIPGEYPPDDTGSSGLAVAKVAKTGGYISAYYHAFGIYHVFECLQNGPVIAGVNWYDSFDMPTHGGTVEISPNSGIRGGHEIEILSLDVDNQRVRFINSWGEEYGYKGYAWMTWDTFHRLLLEKGDVTQLIK